MEGEKALKQKVVPESLVRASFKDIFGSNSLRFPHPFMRRMHLKVPISLRNPGSI